MQPRKPNRLIHEKSPYLLQHAFNPVDWYPWGDEAFERAKAEDKPIFLSVGYSTCYWCHVMEREVFENEELAELLNHIAVNVKVDREERPDVDRIYMRALQAMSGRGGWPMSIFLTHDLKPFYAATYIPPVPRHGIPGFADVLKAIKNVWDNERHKVQKTSSHVFEYLQKSAALSLPKTELSPALLDAGYESFATVFDPQYGGFGDAPKFPTPVTFNFLSRYYNRTGARHALDMVTYTLDRMARGGIYDHIGGGFHRYATDNKWHVPHFEKMLYDQAQLSISYIEAYQITREEYYADVATDILTYVMRVLTSHEGGFYSAEDAESATAAGNLSVKEEGAFYVWTDAEIQSILSPSEFAVAEVCFDIRNNGNVESDPHGVFRGKNILWMPRTLDEATEKLGMTQGTLRETLRTIRSKLFEAREKRPKPHLDDKILVSWNGLMISAFARAYQVFAKKEFQTVAKRAANFILNHLYDHSTGRLRRRYRDGEATIEAQLEDYAFFIRSLIDLYESAFSVDYLDNALRLTDRMIELFYDPEDGGFYDTTGDDSSVILRTKEWHDGAEPSGNSIAIENLFRLSCIFARDDYYEKAMQSLSCLSPLISKAPQATAQHLATLDMALAKPKQIVIAGNPDDTQTQNLLHAIFLHFIPNKVVLLADGSSGQRYLASKVDFYNTVKPIDGKPTAYVCENYSCNLPVTDIEDMRRQLHL